MVLKLDKMTYALIDPVIEPHAQAVPPPDADENYERVRRDLSVFENVSPFR